MPDSKESTTGYTCSFCAKSQPEVKRLIAGQANTFICDNCVLFCQQQNEEKTYVLNKPVG